MNALLGALVFIIIRDYLWLWPSAWEDAAQIKLTGIGSIFIPWSRHTQISGHVSARGKNYPRTCNGHQQHCRSFPRKITIPSGKHRELMRSPLGCADIEVFAGCCVAVIDNKANSDRVVLVLLLWSIGGHIAWCSIWKHRWNQHHEQDHICIFSTMTLIWERLAVIRIIRYFWVTSSSCFCVT